MVKPAAQGSRRPPERGPEGNHPNLIRPACPGHPRLDAYSEIAALLRARFSGEVFTVSTISEIDGRMDWGYWDFVNTPKSSGRWDGLSPLAQALLGYKPAGGQ